MKGVVLSLVSALLSLSTITAQDVWQTCKGSNQDLLKVLDININPLPVKAGKELTVIVKVDLREEVRGGRVVGTIKLKSAFTLTERVDEDLCNIAECPVLAGPSSFETKFTVPALASFFSGLTGTVVVSNEEGVEIGCVNLDIPFSSFFSTDPTGSRSEILPVLFQNAAKLHQIDASTLTLA